MALVVVGDIDGACVHNAKLLWKIEGEQPLIPLHKTEHVRAATVSPAGPIPDSERIGGRRERRVWDFALGRYDAVAIVGQFAPAAHHREVLPGFASPLSICLSLEREYGRALAAMFGDLKMGKAPPGTVWGRPFFGRPYWNVGVVKQFTARVPGFKERPFDATVGIEPTYEGDGLTTPWTPRTVLRALPVLFALNKRYETCWQEAAAFAEREVEHARSILRVHLRRFIDFQKRKQSADDADSTDEKA